MDRLRRTVLMLLAGIALGAAWAIPTPATAGGLQDLSSAPQSPRHTVNYCRQAMHGQPMTRHDMASQSMGQKMMIEPMGASMMGR